MGVAPAPTTEAVAGERPGIVAYKPVEANWDREKAAAAAAAAAAAGVEPGKMERNMLIDSNR